VEKKLIVKTQITYRQNHESRIVVNRESLVLILRAVNIAVPGPETLLEHLD
jgi:hypothetical protein